MGFAAPHGRWRKSLDEQLEDLGYLYSSDFQIGYDDFPFYPWRGDRFSRVLQIPVHPVCEGLFLDAGVDQPELIGDYFRQVIAARLDAGELAVIYGHPERRLGRMPEVMRAIASAVDSRPLVWRASFSELARWWRWRAGRRWLVIPREDDRLEIQFDEWDSEYAFALDIQRGRFQCSVPVTSSRMSLGLRGLVYERRRAGRARAWNLPRSGRKPLSLKRAVKAAIDWETVTPLDQIPRSSIPQPREARAAGGGSSSERGSSHDEIAGRLPHWSQPARPSEWLEAHCRGAVAPGDVILHAPSFAFQAPGGGENQLIQSGRHLEELGIPVRLFSAWTDRLEKARLLHLFGMSREGLELARVARARGIPVVLSPICWYEPRAMAALEPDPIRKIASLAGWGLRSVLPGTPSWRLKLLRMADVVLPNSRL